MQLPQMLHFPAWVLVGVLLAVVIGMNAKATMLVLRDSLSEPSQRLMQLVLVWAFPVIGAVMVFAVHRSTEKHPGTYREPPDPGDDFGYPRFIGRRSGDDDG